DFKGALETLADRFGVKLETEAEDPAAATRRERRERLHKLLGRAATYYARYLWEAREGQDARGHLPRRGPGGREGPGAPGRVGSGAAGRRRRCGSSGSAMPPAPGTGS